MRGFPLAIKLAVILWLIIIIVVMKGCGYGS
jgi:hypothetical protein